MTKEWVISAAEREEQAWLYEAMSEKGCDDGHLNWRHHGDIVARALDVENYCRAPLADSTVLDVGCGTGHLAGVLKGDVAGYLGIDLLNSQVAIAKARHPKMNFMQADFLSLYVGRGVFDYAFCLGILNEGVWRRKLLAELLVGKMWRVAREGMAFAYYQRGQMRPVDPPESFYPTEIERIVREVCGSDAMMSTYYFEEEHDAIVYVAKP